MFGRCWRFCAPRWQIKARVNCRLSGAGCTKVLGTSGRPGRDEMENKLWANRPDWDGAARVVQG